MCFTSEAGLYVFFQCYRIQETWATYLIKEEWEKEINTVVAHSSDRSTDSYILLPSAVPGLLVNVHVLRIRGPEPLLLCWGHEVELLYI